MSERVVNLLEVELHTDPEFPEGHRFSGISVSELVKSKTSGMGLYEIEPGNLSWPYHFHLSVEELLIVLSGELTLRTPDGERVLRAGDVAWFPAGAAGAHTVRNHSDEIVRYAVASTRDEYGGGGVYPDSGKVGVWTNGFYHLGRLGEKVEYWEGET